MKKLLLIPGILGLLLVPAITSGEFDLPGLNKQVQVQKSILDNHEARITNLEKDTSALQENTNTPPTNHDAVPQVQPTPTETPAETPTEATPEKPTDPPAPYLTN